VSIPEPYPCASPGSYAAGELFPYIVGSAAAEFYLAELAEAATASEGAEVAMAAPTATAQHRQPRQCRSSSRTCPALT
jgi:hypothetical protein